MKLAPRAAALGLAALLLLPCAQAADTNAQQRRQDLDLLCATLEERHPDLYANTPRSEFLAKRAEIEQTLATRSELEFTFDLQSLVALAGDSHTTAALGQTEGMRYFPMNVKSFEGALVLTTAPKDGAHALGKAITALNGHPMDEVLARFSTLVSADNPVKLLRQARQMLYVEDILVYLGLAQAGAPLKLTLEDGTVLELSSLSEEEMGTAEFSYLADLRQAQPPTAYDKSKYYFSLPLDADTYYIQYNRCQNDPALSMEDFAAQVERELAAGAYTQVLLDLRNNGGGSDGVISPLLALLAPRVRDGSLRLYGLIGETTFSSAIINAVMLQEMGGVLAGAPTSGSVNHFGATSSFTLPNSGLRVTCSTKWIDLSTLLEAGRGYGVESLRPDVAVELTLADYLAGRDTLTDYLLAHGAEYRAPGRGGDGLTRGRFLTQLQAAAREAGRDVSAPDCDSGDLLFFAYFAPAADWAAANGILQGSDKGLLEPVRLLTRAEAAVLLSRTADYLDLPAVEVPDAPFADEAQLPGWARAAAHEAVARGLMTAADGVFRPDATLTRDEGAALAAALCPAQ